MARSPSLQEASSHLGRTGSLNSVDSLATNSSGRPSPSSLAGARGGGAASSGEGSGSSSPALGGQFYYRSSSRVSHVSHIVSPSGEARRASTAHASIMRPVGAYTTARSPPPLAGTGKAQASKDQHSPHLKYGNPSGKPADFLRRYSSAQQRNDKL